LEARDCPSTLTVTNNLDTGARGDGSLRGEIAAANSGDTIAFASSLKGQTITLSATNGELQIARNLTIQGPGASQLTISGGFNSRVFEVDGSTTSVTLSGVSIIDGIGTAFYPYGNTGWSGGNKSGTTAQDGQGGAIWNGGTLTVSSCMLADNSAAVNGYSSFAGGGIYNVGTLIVSNSTLAHNSVGNAYGYYGNGGGIYNAGTLTVNGSTLSDNIAYGSNGVGLGGGIYSGYKLTVTITGSTLTGNTGSLGGAVYTDGTLALNGSTLSGNSASSEGGGIFNDRQGHLTIQSSVVKNNTAPVGADLFNLGCVKISSDSTVGVIGT
jgi:hypothetical protein